MSDLLYVSTNDDAAGYVPLSRTRQGQLFRKKILPMNKSFVHPADNQTKIFINPEIAETLVKNFNNDLVPHVQTTIVDKDNRHSEDPRDNLGEVLGLEYDETGVYATIDARKHAEDFGKTFLDSSAFLHMNYTDTSTGEKVGPTLLHVAVTNRGHVRDMGDYEPIKEIAASYADNSGENILFVQEEEPAPTESVNEEVVVEETQPNEENNTSKETETMTTKDEAIAFLKGEGIDVEALQAEAASVEALKAEAARVAELSAQLEDVNEQLKLSGEKAIEVTDLAEALVELSNSNKTLSEKIETLETANATYAKRDAEHEVDARIREGKVLPAQRDVMVKLSMTDRETYEALIPEHSLVSLSENGVTVHEKTVNSTEKAEAIADYAARALKLSGKNK